MKVSVAVKSVSRRIVRPAGLCSEGAVGWRGSAAVPWTLQETCLPSAETWYVPPSGQLKRAPASRPASSTVARSSDSPVGACESCRTIEAIDDVHAPASYRQHLAAVLSRRALEKAHARLTGKEPRHGTH